MKFIFRSLEWGVPERNPDYDGRPIHRWRGRKINCSIYSWWPLLSTNVQYHPMMCHCTVCTGNGFLLGSFVNFVCLPRLIELLAHFKFHSITCHFDVQIVIIIDEIVWSTYCCISGRWAIQRSPHKRIKVWLYRIHSNTQTWQKGGRRMS